MKTYISSVMTTQLALLTLIVLITKNKVLSNYKKQRIIIASVMIMICAIAEFSGILLDGSAAVLKPLHIIVKYVEFCLASTVSVVLAGVFCPAESQRPLYVFNALHIALETFSLFTGLIFYIDDKNIYHHGKAYWLYYFFVFLGIMYLSYTIAKFGTQFQNRNHISLLMILIFITAGVAFQIIDSDIRIVWLTVAISTALFYIYYCNMVYQLDALTELLNRRAFEAHKSSLKKQAYIVIFDVNNFKSINDRFGHSLGDACLQSVADVIRKVYRKYGLCYRVGGDEFCVIIDRKINPRKFKELNEKFEKQLLSKGDDDHLMPSVAIGFATYEPGKTEISDVIKDADKQMYLDKIHTKEL